MNDMTEAAINLKIAKSLRLDVEITGTEKVCTLFIIRNGVRHASYGIDYINDPAQREPLMMALLKKLQGVKPYFEPLATKPLNDLYWVWRSKHFYIYGADKHFGTALCLAFIEMMESKDV